MQTSLGFLVTYTILGFFSPVLICLGKRLKGKWDFMCLGRDVNLLQYSMLLIFHSGTSWVDSSEGVLVEVVKVQYLQNLCFYLFLSNIVNFLYLGKSDKCLNIQIIWTIHWRKNYLFYYNIFFFKSLIKENLFSCNEIKTFFFYFRKTCNLLKSEKIKIK